jgi:hypothetical protein
MSGDLTKLADDVLAATAALKELLSKKHDDISKQEHLDSFSLSTERLKAAVEGPGSLMFGIVASQFNIMALTFFLEHGIPDLLSLNSGLPLCDIAAKINVDENRVGRILRLLTTMDVICEDENGFCLTQESITLRNPQFNATIGQL